MAEGRIIQRSAAGKFSVFSYNFSTVTFTSGAAELRFGPTLSEARDGIYGFETDFWKNNTDFFNVSSGIQLWTVPADGFYQIEARGAQGGSAISTNTIGPIAHGGYGVIIKGTVYLERGEVLSIVVGYMPGQVWNQLMTLITSVPAAAVAALLIIQML